MYVPAKVPAGTVCMFIFCMHASFFNVLCCMFAKVFNMCSCLQTSLLVSLDYAYRGHYLSGVKLFWSCFVCYISCAYTSDNQVQCVLLPSEIAVLIKPLEFECVKTTWCNFNSAAIPLNCFCLLTFKYWIMPVW